MRALLAVLVLSAAALAQPIPGSRIVINGTSCPVGGSCTISGSAPTWNAITNPTGNLALTMGGNTSTFNYSSLGTTPTDEFKWLNTTAATSGATVQVSPAINLGGAAWNASGTPATNAVNYRQYLLPVSGSTVTASAQFCFSVAGGSYACPMTMSSAGLFSIFQNSTGTVTRGDFTVDGTAKTVTVGRLSSTAADNSTFFVTDRSGNTKLEVNSTGVGVAGVPVSRLTIPIVLTATSAFGTYSQGAAPFDGTSSGFFTGSSAGTEIAINETTFTGDFLNFQVSGVSAFKVTSAGVSTLANVIATAAAPTVATAQIGYGSTTAAASNCLVAATACVIINVAGTTRYVPYF